MTTEPSPLESITEAQDLLANFYVGFRIALIAFVFGLAVLLASASHVFAVERQLAALAVALLACSLFLFVRTRRSLKGLRLRVNQVFLHHRSKAPETCGSMDPHFTRART